jgi:hypothetical protein
MLKAIDKNSFIYYKNEPIEDSILGIKDNKIVEIPNFVSEEDSINMINYFEAKAEMWGDIAFYGSSGMGLVSGDPMLADYRLSGDYFESLKSRFQEAVELVFERRVRPNTSHAQKWDVGGFANPHSDNSDNHGEPNAFEINKYVAILYLNGNYSGGELYFPDHKIDFKPSAYSLITFPGGVENIHGVREITEGTRYTMVSFWDFEEIEYPEEKIAYWEEETKKVREQQAKQKEEWEKGNKFA